MDTLSHYLWAVVLYWKHPKKYWLAISGAAPDLVSFGAFMILSFFSGSYQPGPPGLDILPSWLFFMYNLSHSLVVAGVVFLILWFFKRDWIIITWGWFLHILIDMPTHTREYFPTPYLWPLSNNTINGFSWGQKWFLVTNFIVLGLVLIYLDFGKRFLKKSKIQIE